MLAAPRMPAARRMLDARRMRADLLMPAAGPAAAAVVVRAADPEREPSGLIQQR